MAKKLIIVLLSIIVLYMGFNTYKEVRKYVRMKKEVRSMDGYSDSARTVLVK